MNSQEIETTIELENVVKAHTEHLERLTAYSVRGILTPVQFVTELKKMQNQTLSICLKKLSHNDRGIAFKELERIETNAI